MQWLECERLALGFVLAALCCRRKTQGNPINTRRQPTKNNRSGRQKVGHSQFSCVSLFFVLFSFGGRVPRHFLRLLHAAPGSASALAFLFSSATALEAPVLRIALLWLSLCILSHQGCGIKGFLPTSVMQDNLPLYEQNSF